RRALTDDLFRAGSWANFLLHLTLPSLITPPISRGRAQHVLVPYRSVLPFRESSRWKATTLLKERLEPSLGKESQNARQGFPVPSRSPAIPSSPIDRKSVV